MPPIGSWRASLNKLIWPTLLCYLLCTGDKIRRLLCDNKELTYDGGHICNSYGELNIVVIIKQMIS